MFGIDINNGQTTGHHFVGNQGVVGSGKDESNRALAIQMCQGFGVQDPCMSDFYGDSKVWKIFFSERDDLKIVAEIEQGP